MIKQILYTLFLVFVHFSLQGQFIENHINNSLKAVVALRTVATEPNSNRQLGIRIGNSDKYEPYYSGLGSAFFVRKELDLYLVTANHVIKKSPNNCILIINDSNNKRKDISLDSILENLPSKWYTHPKSDVSVIRLNEDKLNRFTNGQHIAFGYYQLNDSLIAPKRNTEMMVIGFPGGLGIGQNNISAITKSLKSASKIIMHPYLNKNSEHFLLDDNGFRGFSGGPIIALPKYDLEFKDKSYQPNVTFNRNVIGVVSSGKTDVGGGYGGFYFIVPSLFIKETIDLAPAYEGIYKFKYPDGNLWSEVVYKNGLSWTVLSNFKHNGERQDMGTLKKGNGTLIKYNSEGEWRVKYTYKNGKIIDVKYNDLPK